MCNFLGLASAPASAQNLKNLNCSCYILFDSDNDYLNQNLIMSSGTYAEFNDYIVMLEILKTALCMHCIFFFAVLNRSYFCKKF